MIRVLLIGIALVLPLSACSAKNPQVIGKNDQGKTIVTRTGRTFTIALDGNASTGFSWNVRNLDTAAIRISGTPRYEGRDSLPGTSGTFYLDFTPVAKGVSTITLTYNRDFEIGVEPEDSFSVVIRVK